MKISAILTALGVICIILGLTSTAPLGFSRIAATITCIGGAFLASAFATNSKISKFSTPLEKFYVVVICLSIILLTAAVVLYTVIEVEYTYTPATIGGRGGKPVKTVIEVGAITHHIYESASLSLLGIGIFLLIFALYIKHRFL